MRTVPASMSAAWTSGMFIGSQRPCGRITVQHPQMTLHTYALMSTFKTKVVKSSLPTVSDTYLIDPKHGQKVNQTYANFLFPKHPGKPMELPNVKTISWQRSTDTDVASCTIVMVNSKPLEPGDTPDPGELDLPGYYTYSRGANAFSKSRWGYTRNEWFGMLMPDNLLRTYEGYGSDFTQSPENDPFLVQSGLWIIDKVTMDAVAGTMTITARDIGRILIDQQFYQPVIPDDFYDEPWINWDGTFPTSPVTTKLKVTATSCSNDVWIASGTVAGHKLSYAFDGDANTYWLSVGNDKPSRRFAYEWVQCKVNNQTVSQVQVSSAKSGYTCYISVMVGGVWQGSNTINYHEDGIGRNGADIPYVATMVGALVDNKPQTLTLPKAIKNVQAVRVTFGNLQNFKFGPYQFRAGIRDVSVYGPGKAGKTGYTVGPAGSNPGRYSDYTDIIKLILAWGGFFWPKGSVSRIANPPGVDPIAAIPGYDDIIDPLRGSGATGFDPDYSVLGHGVLGRIWGDLQPTGTSGPDEIAVSNFDKKSLMDGIDYIKQVLGFIFFIDETGGAVWRLPNQFYKGNFLGTLSPHPGYQAGVVHFIAETSEMITLGVNLDGSNVREAFFVGNVSGKINTDGTVTDESSDIGAVAAGWNPNPTGLRRIAGWTDQNFSSTQECQIMADMIALNQLFSYRTNSIRIPANPAIQIDDQARVVERTSSEGYIHYISAISSSLDMTSGEWTYDLTTNWLGFDPASAWLFDPTQFSIPTGEHVTKQKKLAVKQASLTRERSLPLNVSGAYEQQTEGS